MESFPHLPRGVARIVTDCHQCNVRFVQSVDPMMFEWIAVPPEPDVAWMAFWQAAVVMMLHTEMTGLTQSQRRQKRAQRASLCDNLATTALREMAKVCAHARAFLEEQRA